MFEPTFDGFRLLIETGSDGGARAWSRHGTNLTGHVGDRLAAFAGLLLGRSLMGSWSPSASGVGARLRISTELSSARMSIASVKARVDLRMLIGRGSDPQARVFAPAADDPLFGYHSCERTGCPRAGQMDRSRALGLCDVCPRNYLQRREGKRGPVPMTLEQFKAFPVRRVAQADREEQLCLVCCTPGHERAARNHGLCPECNRLRFDRRQTIEAFVAGDERWPPAVPRKGFGRCMVDGCRRWAVTDERLCGPCRRRWRRSRPRGARRCASSSRPARGSRHLTASGR